MACKSNLKQINISQVQQPLTYIKFFTILRFMIVVSLWPHLGLAQSDRCKSAPVSISVSVMESLPVQLTTLNNMNIPANIFNDCEIYISPVNSTFAGLLKAIGSPGSRVRMTYHKDEVLSAVNGNGIISICYELSGNERWLQESSELINTDEAVFNLGSEGQYYLWVGGHINVRRVGVGSYRGQFTLEIEYL